MRAQEFLSELYDRPEPFVWINRPHSNAEVVSAEFKVNDTEYVWYATQNMEEPKSWDIEFQDTVLGYGITGKGNAAVVMSTVLDIMDFFIRRVGATKLTFSADEPSRKKLYSAIIKRLLPNWTVQMENSTFVVTSPYRDHLY
jgi:hypothetical protein